MKVAITGASGFIGRELVPRFEAAGVEVILLGRDTVRLQAQFPGHAVTGYDTLADDLAGVDCLVHLAVRNNDQPGPDSAFEAANVGLLRTVLEAARTAGVKTFVNFTTLHAADAGNASPYARSKRAADALLKDQSDIAVLSVRLPAVYGTTYKGKLGVLNKVPGVLRPLTFQTLAALKPTVHIARVFERVHAALRAGEAGEIIVTDAQAGNRVYAAARKALDLAFVVTVAGLLWWLLLGSWLAVRLTSLGPGLFAQERVGRKGQVFRCYKFRTMQVGTRNVGTHDVDATQITPVGRFLRKTKVDEFPQAWNLLKGEMSVVGPRPCLPVQTDLIEARRSRGVLEVPGGITGWAQIKNVDMSDPEKLAKLDAEYVALRTILLDLKILVATATGHGQGDKTR